MPPFFDPGLIPEPYQPVFGFGDPTVGGDSIDVTASDPGGVTNVSYAPIFDIGVGGPGARDPLFEDFVIGAPEGVDLSAIGGYSPFSDSETAQKSRAEKVKALLVLLGSSGASTEFLKILADAFGLIDYGDLGISGAEFGDPARAAANYLGVPTLPTPNPGATQSVSFLDWQPDNPLGNPSRFVDHQIYRPDKVPPPPGLLQALVEKIEQEVGGGGAPTALGVGPNPGLKNHIRGSGPSTSLRGGGGGRSGDRISQYF
jgi:hypothetical protein